MFVAKNWHRFATLTAFVCALALAGCGKKDDQPQVENKKDGDITMDDLRKAAKAAGGDLDAKTPAVPLPSLANEKPDVTYMMKAFHALWDKHGGEPLREFPKGKVIEVTGVVQNMIAKHAQRILRVRFGEKDLDCLEFSVTDQQPWKKVLPSQTVTLRVKTTEGYSGNYGARWEIVGATGSLPALTAEQIARDNAETPDGAKTKNDQKVATVTGTILTIRGDSSTGMDLDLDGGANKPVRCIFDEDQLGLLAPEQKKFLTAGQKVKLVGKVDNYRLQDCILLEPAP